MVLHARLSNLFNKMVRQMTILTDLVICIFLCNKRIFCQKNYPVVFVMPYPIYHKNVSEIEFSIFMDGDLISTEWPRVFNTLNFFVRKCFHQK